MASGQQQPPASPRHALDRIDGHGGLGAIVEALSAVDALSVAEGGLSGLDDLPRSILIYRQLLQWLGGIGIIVVVVRPEIDSKIASVTVNWM